jgi:hypothetical protein
MKAKQHLYNALNAMSSSVPSIQIDIRDEIIDAQDVALTLDEEDRIAVCKIITLLRTRQASIDRISEAWSRSVEQIKLAIKEIESEPEPKAKSHKTLQNDPQPAPN